MGHLFIQGNQADLGKDSELCGFELAAPAPSASSTAALRTSSPVAWEGVEETGRSFKAGDTARKKEERP